MSAVRTRSEQETMEFGARLARRLPKQALVLLIGNLGAGKTTLTKGIAEGLGAAEADEVSSPTFTLVHQYGEALYHIDLYRLDTEAEVRSLGLEELFDRQAVVLIEWGERFPGLWPEERIEVTLTRVEDEEREIAVRELGGCRLA
jgi:tRNA threonylcarbamoyladenosine biosynthesis protein TsaE